MYIFFIYIHTSPDFYILDLCFIDFPGNSQLLDSLFFYKFDNCLRTQEKNQMCHFFNSYYLHIGCQSSLIEFPKVCFYSLHDFLPLSTL